MTSELILLGTSASGGLNNLIYPLSNYGRDHACAFYVAEDGRGYLIDAPFNIRNQLHQILDVLVTDGYTLDEFPKYFGGMRQIERPVSLNIEAVIFTNNNDTCVNGFTALRDIPNSNKEPLRLFAHPETLEHLKVFGFPFDGRLGIYTPGGERTTLKFEGYEFQASEPTPISDNLFLEHAMVRQGSPDKRSAVIALPGFVYAPAVSHIGDDFLDLVARTKPHTVVLDLQCEVRLDDNYPRLGIREFLQACEDIAAISPGTRRVVSTGMGDLAGSNEELEAILVAGRGDFNIPSSLEILVGRDGMRIGPDGVRVAPTARLGNQHPAPGSPRP